MLDDLPIPVNPIGVACRAGKIGSGRGGASSVSGGGGLRLGEETLYVSCAQLIRVRWRAKYLLVPNSRWKQMQPPGGVVQLHSAGPPRVPRQDPSSPERALRLARQGRQ